MKFGQKNASLSFLAFGNFLRSKQLLRPVVALGFLPQERGREEANTSSHTTNAQTTSHHTTSMGAILPPW